MQRKVKTDLEIYSSNEVPFVASEVTACIGYICGCRGSPQRNGRHKGLSVFFRVGFPNKKMCPISVRQQVNTVATPESTSSTDIPVLPTTGETVLNRI